MLVADAISVSPVVRLSGEFPALSAPIKPAGLSVQPTWPFPFSLRALRPAVLPDRCSARRVTGFLLPAGSRGVRRSGRGCLLRRWSLSTAAAPGPSCCPFRLRPP